MSIVYLGLGTNLGDKAQNLDSAIQRLKTDAGDVLAISTFYSSEPWGFNSDNLFLNAAVKLSTRLSPYDLLDALQQIEKDLGRITKSINENYADRSIDIDILLYDDLIIHSPRLTIPHPLMQERDFVLTPLAEIAGEIMHPELNKSIVALKVELLNLSSEAETFSVPKKNFDFPTKLYCQTLDLKDDPALIAMYKLRHTKNEVWGEVLTGLRVVGILGMDIYIQNNRLFMIVETASDFNWEQAFAKLNTLPRQEEWEEYMSVFQQAEKGASSSEKWQLMERIFYLYD